MLYCHLGSIYCIFALLKHSLMCIVKVQWTVRVWKSPASFLQFPIVMFSKLWKQFLTFISRFHFSQAFLHNCLISSHVGDDNFLFYSSSSLETAPFIAAICRSCGRLVLVDSLSLLLSLDGWRTICCEEFRAVPKWRGPARDASLCNRSSALLPLCTFWFGPHTPTHPLAYSPLFFSCSDGIRKG